MTSRWGHQRSTRFPKAHLDGGSGSDDLEDRLYDGPSRDRADGGPGVKDVCRAEQKRRCER